MSTIFHIIDNIFNVMNHIEEGIIILNYDLQILFWNNYMEDITEIKCEDVIDENIYKIIPKLNESYYKKSIQLVLKKGYNIFFSAAMHRELIKNDKNLNLKISILEHGTNKFLLMEFIDVTNQFLRISQLKQYVNDLYDLNDELKHKEKSVRKLAYYDELTDVANRTLFYKLARELISNAQNYDSTVGLMFIDVDNFKHINDTYGHRMGDKVLIQVGKILKNSTREGDIVARYGGDEFLVLLPHIKNYENYEIIANRIVNEYKKNVIYYEEGLESNISIGFSMYPYGGKDIEELILNADKDMYAKKNKYKNTKVAES